MRTLKSKLAISFAAIYLIITVPVVVLAFGVYPDDLQLSYVAMTLVLPWSVIFTLMLMVFIHTSGDPLYLEQMGLMLLGVVVNAMLLYRGTLWIMNREQTHSRLR